MNGDSPPPLNPATVDAPSKLNFQSAEDFAQRVVLAASRNAGSEILIDLSATVYMDSSGLGTLLVLRDRARAYGQAIVLARAQNSVREALRLAHFDRLFEIR